ncbi:MAG: hypothetical protein L3J96_02285, partial [Thermoplasmata archaeon]|nr:hypothetical protein [Thermoplasmata archaeon]
MGMGSSPELDSLKSMLRIAKIVALIFLILSLLAVIGFAVLLASFGLAIFAGFFLIAVLINLIIYLQVGAILSLVEQGQFARAKEKTLIWMIL